MTPSLAELKFQVIHLATGPRTTAPYVATWVAWPSLGVSILYSLIPHLDGARP